MFEVFIDGGVEVLGVALVQTVDLPLGLDPHAPFSQDELADGLIGKQTFSGNNRNDQDRKTSAEVNQRQRIKSRR